MTRRCRATNMGGRCSTWRCRCVFFLDHVACAQSMWHVSPYDIVLLVSMFSLFLETPRANDHCAHQFLAETTSYVKPGWRKGCVRKAELLFLSFSSHSRCEIKRPGGKKLNYCRNFKVPGSNLACTPAIDLCTRCFSKTRISEIIRAGGREFSKKRNRLIHPYVALFK